MAEFPPAVALTLQHEGGFFHNPITGEVVNFGVTLTFVKDCGYCTTADEAYIRNLTQATAEQIYQKYFWDLHRLGEVNDQSLANKIFDLTVNMGAGSKAHPGALTLLQQAVCDCGGDCSVDGILGSQSIAAINAQDPVKLLAAFRARATAHYTGIAANNPNLQGDLKGWLARLAED